MTARTNCEIKIEKTLHKKNAFVLSIGYLSRNKPILQETIQEGLREYEGRKDIRISQDNGKTWTVTAWMTGKRKEAIDPPTRCRKLSPGRDQWNAHPVLRRGGVRGRGRLRLVRPRRGRNPPSGTDGRIVYHFSQDEGRSWGPMKQLIQTGRI